MTEVVNVKQQYDVYIGRAAGSKGYFGNPFIIGRDGDRDQVIRKYKEYFLKKVEEDAVFKSKVLELRGKRLGCFCKPLACHGDVIKEWINKTLLNNGGKG